MVVAAQVACKLLNYFEIKKLEEFFWHKKTSQGNIWILWKTDCRAFTNFGVVYLYLKSIPIHDRKRPQIFIQKNV